MIDYREPPPDLLLEIAAIRRWLKALYVISCRGAPAEYADYVRSLIVDAKNATPPADSGLASDAADRLLLAMLPHVEQLGGEIIHELEARAAFLRDEGGGPAGGR